MSGLTDELAPCLNEGCPDHAKAPLVRIVGEEQTFEFRTLCERCAAESEEGMAAEDRRRTVDKLLSRPRMGPRYRDFSLETYPTDKAGAKAKAEALVWLERFRAGDQVDLVLVGKAGVGKTGLAWSLIRELIETSLVEADMVNLRDLLATVRTAYAEGKHGDPTRRLREVGLLCLDDVGAERPTEWAMEELAGIVEARYQWRRPTIWTSNYKLSDLAKHFAGDGGDETVGERIVSRIADGSVIVYVGGKDRRLSR